VASFAGFAPINDPSITVAVILDSAVGLHQGGQVSAPVFQRVAQQVLEYLHTPHDVDLPPSRQVLLAERQVKEQDIEEGSPDRLGDTFEPADTESTEVASAGGGANQLDPQLSASPAKPTPNVTTGVVVPAALRKREAPSRAPEQSRPIAGVTLPTTTAGGGATSSGGSTLTPLLSSGTVVLDVEQGGILVPSFLGKSVRAAIEIAQENGLDLDAVGNGLAREQSPPPGSHVASGTSVTVKFGR
jgi:cell division protein FtsI (penicillin-binding protein 3)